MAIYDLTPNIGLKNIKIGERPWGNEERENKIILDSVISNISNSGKLKISLKPQNAIKLVVSSAVIETLAHNEPVVSFEPITEIGWLITAAETYEYSPRAIPFVSKSLVTTNIGKTFLYGDTDSNFINEIMPNDEIKVGELTCIVKNVTASVLEVDKTFSEQLNGVQMIVNPSGSDRVKLEVKWVAPSACTNVAWGFNLNTLLDGEEYDIQDILVKKIHSFVDFTSTEANKVTTSTYIFSPEVFEINPGKPSIFKLSYTTSSPETTIKVLSVDFTLAREKNVPCFLNNIYNINVEELDTVTTEYTYDSDGNIIESSEILVGGLTRITNFVYDAEFNIIQQRIDFDNSITTEDYTYDTLGNIIRIDKSIVPSYKPNTVIFP
jgi:hypothetical protein